MTTTRLHPGSRRPARGFTLVELLVSIAIIALLVGILIVGMFGALSFARRAAGMAQLQAISQGVEAFNNDMGFYPPLVGKLEKVGDDATDAIQTPESLAAQAPKAQRNATLAQSYRDARYMSEWTLAAFLIGQGDLNGDGNNTSGLNKDDTAKKLSQDDGKDGLGLRNPGESRAWKSADGSHKPQITGREYGPYLDPGFVEKYLQRVPVEYDDVTRRIVQADGSTQVMYRIVDAFDVPVRYYRGWVTRDQDDKPTVLRLPIELRSAEGVENQIDTGKAPVEMERGLMTAPYALLSAGERADRYLDENANEVSPFGDRLLYTDGGTKVKHMQADGDGVFIGDQTDLDLSGLAGTDAVAKDQAKSLLKFLKSNIRYIAQ